jgi:hypothetical protein
MINASDNQREDGRPLSDAEIRATNLAAAHALASAGLPVFPAAVSFNPRTGLWDKSPHIAGWKHNASTDADQIERWWQLYPWACPGIPLGLVGLIAVDCDRHGGPDGIATLNELAAVHGGMPSAPITRTAGDGLHVIFRQRDGEALGNREGGFTGRGINIRGDGGWIAGPGAMRRDGRQWLSDEAQTSLADAFRAGSIPMLPDWIADIILTQPKKQAHAGDGARQGDDGVGSQETGPNRSRFRTAREAAYARAALEMEVDKVAASRPGERNNALNSAAFVLGTMVARDWIDEEEVSHALLDAAQRCGLTTDDGLASVEATIRSGLSGGKKHPREDLGDPKSDPDDDNDKPPGGDTSAEQPGSDDFNASWDGGKRPGGFQAFWHGDKAGRPHQLWMVKNLLPRIGVALLAGQSGAGKTFLEIDLAVSLALGEPFFGRKVAQAGGTLILAGEASGTIEARIDAAKIGRSSPFYREVHVGPATDVPDRLPIAWANVGGLSNPKTFDQLLNHVAQIARDMKERFGIQLMLIVVDTLAASFGFSDENDAAEATAAMKSLERLSQATDTLVLGVAHYGKVAETGVRGSSAFTASSDVIIAVIADKDQTTGNVGSRQLALIKSRTGATGWGCPFELRQVGLGTDEDGDAITSCVVVANLEAAGTGEGSTKEAASTKLSPAAKILFDCVVAVIADRGSRIRPFGTDGPEVMAARLPDVEGEFFARYATPSGSEEQRRDAKRKAYKRALDRLVDMRRIVTREDERGIFVWLASQPSSKAV